MRLQQYINEEKIEEFNIIERNFSTDDSNITIGLANIHAEVPNIEYNKNKISRAVDIMKSKGANMVIFPEFCLAGYFWGDKGDEKCWEYMDDAVIENHQDWMKNILEQKLDGSLQFIIFNNIRKGWSTERKYINSTYIINKNLKYMNEEWIYDKTFLPGIENVYTVSGKTDRVVLDTKWGRFGFSTCLKGDSLISTKEHGLIPIKKLRGKEESTILSLNGNKMPFNKFMYNGKNNISRIKTYSGYKIECTNDHKILVYDSGIDDITWKELSEITKFDKICINTKPITRNSPLKLNLAKPKKLKYAHNIKSIKIPEYMTPDLSFWISLIISEGCYSNYKISFINSSKKLIEKFCKITLEVFGLDCSISLRTKKGDRIYNGNYISNNDVYEVAINSRNLSEIMNQMGISISNSHEKVVPWCILQSDKESQLSYLAGYIEGDGTIHKDSKDIIFASKSVRNLEQIQLILITHGIISRLAKSGDMPYLRVGRGFSDKLYPMIDKYMVDKRVENFPNHRNSYKFGVPSSILKTYIDERKIYNKKTYISEDKKEVRITKHSPRKMISYINYDNGIYDEWLDSVRKAIPTYYKVFEDIIDSRYFFDDVDTIEYNIDYGDVYDISVNNDSPAFTANGIVVHNCYDYCFSQLYQEMSLIDKVDGVIQMASWRGTSERDYPGMNVYTDTYYGDLWDMLMCSTSARNQIWTIACNAVGIHGISGAKFWGGSGLWSPAGLKLIQAGHSNDELVIIHNIDIKGEKQFEKDDFDYSVDFNKIYDIINGKRAFTRI